MIEMDESEDNMSADTKIGHTPTSVKSKPKKKSLVERELETSLTAHFTSPMAYGEASGTSRYGRARRLKTDSDFIGSEKVGMKSTKSPAAEKTPAKLQTSPVYKMHASNSPIKVENTNKTPIKIENVETNLENQIENIYNENISLSRFGSSEKRKLSPGNVPKLYVRKDLIQKKEKEETIMLMKNMFSPQSGQRASNSHLSNVLERSSDKYSLNSSVKKSASSNGFINNSSVVKALDFDSNKKKKEKSRTSLSKSELFELEAKCEYQVGDLAWARMGSYPFWPCIVTREPVSGMFVRKKLFGRIERDIIHVTFFGDNGRRSWIVDSMLRKFLGQLEFEATREHFSPTAKKRDPRLYAAFFVSEKKMPPWSISVEEAETLLREPKRLRIDIFNDMLAKSRSMKVAKSKSGKVARTNSDVSLSESLYDTLFSENNRQSEESNGSRSKTRKSLDVSEVVTACLDNMAAKTGMTKIQKQSHMDRWLQKAKSKTPEKSQVKLQVPPKEKERVISSKKKRWEAPRIVSVKKPYSLRKSNESRNLMSQDNEHDYSSTPNKAELPGITIGIITKVESLKDKAEKREIIDVTPAKVDMNKTNGTCDSPTFTQDYDDLIFAHEINTERCGNSEVTLNSDVVHSDFVKDINMSIDEGTNMYKMEEKLKERSLEPLENNSILNCIEVSNTLNVMNSEVANSDSVNDINMSIDEGTNNDKMEEIIKEQSLELFENNSTKTCNEIPNTLNDHNMNSEAKQWPSYLHMNGHSEDIKDGDNGDSESSAVASVTDKPLYNSNGGDDHESKIDTVSPNNLKESEACILDSSIISRCNGFEVSLSVESIENSDADTSIDNLSQSLEQNDSYYNFAKPLGRSKPLRKRSLRLKNRTKSNIQKSQHDGFAKYVELQKDTIMDENPELSEEEIIEYLQKTWQYQTGEGQDATQQEQRDKTHNGRRRGEAKQRDTIDNKEPKKIENNSSNDKISDILLQAEKKVGTVNLTDNPQDERRTKEDKQRDTIDNKYGNKIENKNTKDKVITTHLPAQEKVCTVNLTDKSQDGKRRQEDKQKDTINNKDNKNIEKNSNNDKLSTIHLLKAEKKVCTVNLTAKAQDGIKRKEDKHKDTIDNKDNKNIEKNSTNDKLSTIHLLKAEKKDCTVNLTAKSQDGRRRKKDKQRDTIDNKDNKNIEQNSTNDKLSTIHLLKAEKKDCTVNLTAKSQDGRRRKEDKQRDTIDNKDNKNIEKNSTNDKLSTIHLLKAEKKDCTVNLTAKSQDGRRRKEDKQKDTIDNKGIKNIEKNSTNDKLSTIHLLKAEKKVCTVNLTDILRHNYMSVAFKNGEKTCVLPVIKFNNLNKDEIGASNDSNESVVHNNDNHLINDKICHSLDCEMTSCESVNGDIQTDRKGSNIIKIVKRKMENMDSESQRNVSLKCDVQCSQNNSNISSKIGELHNPDSESIYITPDQEKYNSGNIFALDSATSLPHRCLDKENLTDNKETIDSTITVATHHEEESNNEPCDQNNSKNCSKVVELHSMDSKSVYITPDQEKHNSSTVSELDLKTSLDHTSIDNEKLSDNIETIGSTIIVATQNEKESLKSIATENEDTTIDLLNKDSNIIEVVKTKIENTDTETQFNVSLKSDEQCDKNNTINSSKIVELYDTDSESVCITPDQDKQNITVSELDLKTSLHHNSSDNEKLSENKETIDITLTVAPHNQEESFSIATESEKTPIQLLNNIGSNKLDTLQQKNDELNGQYNSSTSDNVQNGDSTKSEQNNQDISPLESEDSNTVALESTSQITMNNLSNDLKNESKAVDNNLIKNDEEVDSIIKSIDNFVNNQESPIDTLDSDLQNGKCLELSHTINGCHKEEEPTEKGVSVFQSLDNISGSLGEQSILLNDVAIVTEQTTTGELKSITTKSDNVKVSNENPSTLEGETSEPEEVCPQNVIEPTKVNGFHSFDDCTPDVSDGEFNAETSSIHSEDSEPLSVVRSKLQIRGRQKLVKDRNNPDFLKYVEIRQDALIDEHPELNQEEIIEYMYKAWLYEEDTKSDYMKTDDIEQSGLVKGLNDNLRQKSIRNSFKKRKPKPFSEDSISTCSDTSDSSVKRRLRQRSVQSPIVVLENLSIYKSPERKLDDNDNCKSVKPDISENHTDTKQQINSNKSTKIDSSQKDKQTNSTSLKNQKEDSDKHETQNEKVGDFGKTSPYNTTKDSETNKYFDIFKQNEKINKNPKIKNEFQVKVEEEFDPDTVSINSEDSEVSLSVSKRKQRKYPDKQPTKNDPEFLKYVELRQDALMDEHPELSEEEIISYLFKTWLYEESIKSDIKKSDELEQANLVKGLNTDTQQPKKVNKKIKVEKDVTTDDDIIVKEKPKRKSSHPYYVEDDLSDSEDIEMFDIFKSKTKLSTDGTDEIVALDEAEHVVDVVELYFSDLIKPKPNVFKGLLREKVCEICEKTSNLVKCKGCNCMFHVDCVKKEVEVKVEALLASRGRKKKKKTVRKLKNLDESGSQSDEKSQEFSEDNNQSIEEITELETYTVDAENFESLLEVKMKELISTEANYDTSFSDCGITWNSAVAGKCEIVDVKLQSKIEPDYSDFKCNKCVKHDIPVCSVCKLATSKTGVEYRQRCQTAHCYRYYHMECLDHWPQTQFHARDLSKIGNFEEFMCPRHVCHTCVSDDPRGCKTRFSGDKLARCVKCPATYHTFTKCLPAGSQILTGSHIVCPRHYDEHRPGKVPCHVNTGWCFICALGGSLICCEYCPTSFHAECLNIKPPEGGYMCEDCETGRLPLYGEMVWVKLGNYRWWPGLILHPTEIPDNIMAVKHSQGEFVVRFFGQYDYYWVNRGRVFPFQEGDSGRISGTKSKIDAAFTTAMEHAQRACEIMKRAVVNEEEETDLAMSLLPPHYVKLKVNKPVGSVVSRRADAEESSLTQCDCSPKVDDPCGPYSHCLNRMLLTECGPSCRAGDRCNNRAFEKRLYPRMAPYKTPHRGWGLRTLEDIKAGQFVIEYVGELIDEEEFRRRMNRKHEIRDENFYFLTLDKERMIDAGPKGNLARFMNHCCEPNCETQKWTVLGDVRVGLFAINDIPANSELTFNYNLECVGIEKKRCLCGAKRCSGYMGAKPKQDEPKKTKRVYNKKRKTEESPSTSKNKLKRPVGRPAKPKELTEIEKDLIIIKNATNGLSSDSECSGRLSSLDSDRNIKALKRKRVDFSTEDSTNTKKVKLDEEKTTEVGD